MAFLLNSQAKGVSRKRNNLPKHHGAGPQRRGAQCSCIGCIGLRPALLAITHLRAIDTCNYTSPCNTHLQRHTSV